MILVLMVEQAEGSECSCRSAPTLQSPFHLSHSGDEGVIGEGVGTWCCCGEERGGGGELDECIYLMLNEGKRVKENGFCKFCGTLKNDRKTFRLTTIDELTLYAKGIPRGCHIPERQKLRNDET